MGLSQIEAAIRQAKDRGAQAVYIWPSALAWSFAKQIADAANANGLPCVSPFTEGAESGCLLGLGADFKEQNRRAAAYVDQILRGIPPGDLPVEQMSKYGLFINLRTAKALGITIPPSLLARADEVIE
jgi:putative ABC transport system substrate-binding protein